MIYVKVNGALYPATIDGQMQDYTWDNRDGTVSIKMGKPTDLEDAMELLLGGETA